MLHQSLFALKLVLAGRFGGPCTHSAARCREMFRPCLTFLEHSDYTALTVASWSVRLPVQ